MSNRVHGLSGAGRLGAGKNPGLNMKIGTVPKIVLFVLMLLGTLGLLDEAWRAPTPPALVRFLLDRHLWNIWNQLRWQYMYSHEVFHFLSGVFGSLLGCWIYFRLQKRKA
jgi:hypothetical protein